MKLKAVTQQSVVVVGAASGIGRNTALRFAERGARLTVADNDEQGLRSLVEDVRRSGGQVTAVTADVAYFDQVQAISERAIRTYGCMDTWVHCPGILIFATFEDTTPEEFRRTVDVNLMGEVYGAKAALPYLRRSGGALILISSVEARRSFPYHSAYAAAKHGIDGFIEAMRLELQHDDVPVSVTQILPATINTPLFDKEKSKIGVQGKGMPPFYSPDTVSQAILYASEHPTREIVVGGSGKMLLWSQRLSPRVTDVLMERTAFTAQRTNRPISPAAPNNIFAPAGRYNRVEGDFGNQALRHSFTTWLDRHPAVKAAATLGAAVGIGVVLAQRADGTPRSPISEDRRFTGTIGLDVPREATARAR